MLPIGLQMMTFNHNGQTHYGIDPLSLMPKPHKHQNSIMEDTWGTFRKQILADPSISPHCNLCRLQPIDNCLHLLSCCTTNTSLIYTYLNIHAIATTLLMHPSAQNYKRIHADNTKNWPVDNTLSSYLLPCTCYLPKCKCPACFHLDILWIRGTNPHDTPPFHPSPQIQIPFIDFTQCNVRFSPTAITCKHN